MKLRKLILASLLIIGFAYAANAQRNVIKTNPIGMLFGYFPIGLEHTFDEHSSMDIGLRFTWQDASLNGVGKTFFGVGGYAAYRYYFGTSDPAPRGFYLSPLVSYNYSTASDAGETGHFTTLNFSGLVGYQWVFPKTALKGFALDLAGGVAYYNTTSSDNVFNVGIDSYGPNIRLAIGYAF